MKITHLEGSNFNLVTIKKNTPHCIIHGAMNKVSTFDINANKPYLFRFNNNINVFRDKITKLWKAGDIGGYWRCLQGQCRAGCQQLTEKE